MSQLISNDEFQELRQDVSEIKKAVIGDTKWGTIGLIRRVEKLEGWRDNINLRVAFTSGVVISAVELGKMAIEYFTGHKS